MLDDYFPLMIVHCANRLAHVPSFLTRTFFCVDNFEEAPSVVDSAYTSHTHARKGHASERKIQLSESFRGLLRFPDSIMQLATIVYFVDNSYSRYASN